MADLEAVLADVSYLMAMEKSKCTPAARASKKIVLPDPRYALLFYVISVWRCVRFDTKEEKEEEEEEADGAAVVRPSVRPHIRRRTSPRFLPLPSSSASFSSLLFLHCRRHVVVSLHGEPA